MSIMKKGFYKWNKTDKKFELIEEFEKNTWILTDTFDGIQGEESILYILSQDCVVSGVSYKKGFYTWNQNEGFVIRSGASEIYTDTRDLATITNPSNQTIYRLIYEVYEHNNSRAENVIFYKALGSTVVTSTGVSVNGQAEVAYADIVISDIIDWISDGYIEASTFDECAFAKYENGTGGIFFDAKATITEKEAYDLYFNPTGTAGIDNFIKISSSDAAATSYNDVTNKPKLNGEVIVGDKTSADYRITMELPENTYNGLSDQDKMDGTAYFVDNGEQASANVEVRSFNNLTDKPSVNGVTLRAGLTAADLDMYTRAETDAKFSGVFSYKGVVADIAHLPSASDSKAGDVYYVTDESASFAFNGSAYENIGGAVDLSAYQLKEDTSLETSSKNIVGAINELNTNKANKNDIVDNLTSEDGQAMLSAKQGKVLQDTKENSSNKVTSITKDSTNTQYPSAKATYDYASPLQSSYNDFRGTIDNGCDTCIWNMLVRTATQNPRVVEKKIFANAKMTNPIDGTSAWGELEVIQTFSEEVSDTNNKYNVIQTITVYYTSGKQINDNLIVFRRIGYASGITIDNITTSTITWKPWYPLEYPLTSVATTSIVTNGSIDFSVCGGNMIIEINGISIPASSSQQTITNSLPNLPQKRTQFIDSACVNRNSKSVLFRVTVQRIESFFNPDANVGTFGQIVVPLGY